jgi:hypothetical protein
LFSREGPLSFERNEEGEAQPLTALAPIPGSCLGGVIGALELQKYVVEVVGEADYNTDMDRRIIYTLTIAESK